MKRRTRKQLLLKLGVFLLFGAIVNVAVAWGFAIWGSCEFTSHRFYSHSDRPRWQCSVDHGVGVTDSSFVPDNGNWLGETSPPGAFAIPYWSAARARPLLGMIEDSTMPWSIERATGWPLRTAIGEICNRKPTRTWAVETGIAINRNSGDSMPFRLLPLRPIWPGFAINTIFYAALLWVLWFAPGKIRRLIRFRRGCCPACGYKIAEGVGPVCSECGAQLPLPVGEGRGEGARGER